MVLSGLNTSHTYKRTLPGLIFLSHPFRFQKWFLVIRLLLMTEHRSTGLPGRLSTLSIVLSLSLRPFVTLPPHPLSSSFHSSESSSSRSCPHFQGKRNWTWGTPSFGPHVCLNPTSKDRPFLHGSSFVSQFILLHHSCHVYNP